MAEPNKMMLEASCVLYVKFLDGNKRTFFSRDIEHHRDNVHYWFGYLKRLAENKWPGKVEEFAIYRAVKAQRTGDALIKVKNAHPHYVAPGY